MHSTLLIGFESTGPIIILTPSSLNSLQASFNFSAFDPESFGKTFIDLLFISCKARFTEYRTVSPKSLSSPEKGAKTPIFNKFSFLFSFEKT